jgi:RNA polymerase-binding protein DksA
MMSTNRHIDADTVAEFRRRLDEMRARLLRRVMTTSEELATLEPHPAGGLDEDVPTALATAVLSRLEGREKHELDEIDAAQSRLAAGVYGVCEGCGGAIPLERLRALPVARHCLACRTRDEAREALAG